MEWDWTWGSCNSAALGRNAYRSQQWFSNLNRSKCFLNLAPPPAGPDPAGWLTLPQEGNRPSKDQELSLIKLQRSGVSSQTHSQTHPRGWGVEGGVGRHGTQSHPLGSQPPHFQVQDLTAVLGVIRHRDQRHSEGWSRASCLPLSPKGSTSIHMAGQPLENNTEASPSGAY